MIVGRDDGTIQIYQIEDAFNPINVLLAKATTDESITGLDVGPIRDPAVPEIVIATYSGRVMSYWDSRKLDINDPKIKQAKLNKENALKGEVHKLKEKVIKTRQEKESKEESMIPVSENIQPANVRLKIIPSDAAYLLTIESQALIVIVKLSIGISGNTKQYTC